ncbi:MAG: hypothetical protein SCALA701_30950 [Candidatus Scalindua sp.]|nr:MAG: hypothetical protein SCALA701_30950 [Candidatus Scalindua sp.]
MSYNFIECNREQQYLLPPSLMDWLPGGDLAWFILDAVEQMDLKEFYKKYRKDGWGRESLRTRYRLQNNNGESETRP